MSSVRIMVREDAYTVYDNKMIHAIVHDNTISTVVVNTWML